MDLRNCIAFLRKWSTTVGVVSVLLLVSSFFFFGSVVSHRANLRDAAGGSMVAQLRAATRYESRSDYERAAHWYHEAASRGHPVAKYHLANLHRFGHIPNPDLGAALVLMQEAAKGHYADAQLSLGNFYRLGVAGEPDPVAGYLWVDIARYNHGRPADLAAFMLSAGMETVLVIDHLTAEQIEAVHRESLAWRQQYPEIYDQTLSEHPLAEEPPEEHAPASGR